MSEQKETQTELQKVESLSPEALRLAQALTSGTASVDDIDKVQALVRTVLVTDLLAGTRAISTAISPYYKMWQKFNDKLPEAFETALEMATDFYDIIKLMSELEHRMINIVDLQRKIVQGKDIFSDYPTLSDEEKGFIKVLNSIKSPEDRKRFLKLVKDTASGALTPQEQKQTKEKYEDFPDEE